MKYFIFFTIFLLASSQTLALEWEHAFPIDEDTYRFSKLTNSFSLQGVSQQSVDTDSSGNIFTVFSADDVVHFCHNNTTLGDFECDEVDTGEQASIVVETSNLLHISYYNPDDKDLMYARSYNGGSSWTLRTIDSTDDVGQHNAIALKDTDNSVHDAVISYYDETSKDLKVALVKPSGTTTLTTVDSATDVGLYTSIGVDSTGDYHVSYYDQHLRNLKYAFFDGSSWTKTTLHIGSNDVGKHTNLKIDPFDDVHLVYMESPSTSHPKWKINYLVNASGTWSSPSIVEDSFDYLFNPTLDVDSTSGYPQVGYCDYGVNKMRYAKLSSIAPVWLRSTITDGCNGTVFFRDHSTTSSGTNVIELGFMIADIQEHGSDILIHSFDNHTNPIANFIKNQSDEVFSSAAWYTIEDTSHLSGFVFNNSDYPVFVHYNSTSGFWELAEYSSSSYSFDNISISFAHNKILRLDSSDNAYIYYTSYSSSTSEYTLRYRDNSSGSWATSSTGLTFSTEDFDFVFDNSDNIHIAKTDSATLYHITDSSGSYVETAVDTTVGSTIEEVKLNIDSSGFIHIVYLTSGDELKYATNTSGTWTTESIEDLSADIYLDPHLNFILDSQDDAHIAIYYVSWDDMAGVYHQRKVYYATNNSGSWTSETPEAAAGWRRHSGFDQKLGLFVNANDEPYLIYNQMDEYSWSMGMASASYDSTTSTWTIEHDIETDLGLPEDEYCEEIFTSLTSTGTNGFACETAYEDYIYIYTEK